MTVPDRKQDRRIQRTRHLLREALMSLILEKGYDSITVQDITERANVGRATFYLHFTDKDDLLFSGMRDIYDKLVQLYKSQTPEEVISRSLHADFQHIAQYQDFYREMFSERGSLVFLVRTRKFLAQAILETFIEPLVAHFQLTPALPVELIAEYAAGAQFATIAWWLEQQPDLPPESISMWTEQLAYRGMLPMLGLENLERASPEDD